MGKKFSIIAFVSYLVFTGIVVFFLVGITHTEKFGSLGPWGDFVGGVLNPILTSLSFIAILYSISIQQKDLQATLEEMKRSGDALAAQTKSQQTSLFNSNFFNLLDTLDRYKETMVIRTFVGTENARSRDFFDSAL